MSPVAEDRRAAVVRATAVNVSVEQCSPVNVIGRIRGVFHKNPCMEWLILVALWAVMLGQLFLSVGQLSEICDESTHLYAGYRFLKCGDADLSREHPPLARIVAAAPLLPMDLEVDCSPVKGGGTQQALTSHAWLYSHPDWKTALFHARMAVSVFAVGLCLLVWIAARRMFGITTAIVATVLLIFDPSVLASGALVMTDIPVTCTLLFAVFGFYLWVRNHTFPLLLLAGLATGLALLAKHSGVLAIPVLCVLAIADAYIQKDDERPKLRVALGNLLAVGLVCVLAAGTVWAGYSLRFATRSGQPQVQEPQRPSPSSNTGILLAMENSRMLPLPYIEGFAEALAMTNLAVPSFAVGQNYQGTPWFSVPAILAIRYTAAFLVMIPLGIMGAALSFKQYRREFLFLLVPASIYLAVCLHASRIGGIRHMLPMFPFLLIAVAAGCVVLAGRVRWVNYAVICLIVLHSASSLHAYPNYLSYANEFWGGPTEAYKYLPGLDLGQGYLQARDYLVQHPADPCWLLTGWQWDPGLYGVPCQPVGYWFPVRIPARMRGTVIVSSTLLSSADAAVGPFTQIKPKDSIGGSALLVFEGDFNTRAAASVSAWQEAVTFGSLDAANDAVALAPENPYAHQARCMLLADRGQLIVAIAECDIAIKLTNDNPHQQAEVQQFKQAIQRRTHGLPNP